MKRPAFLAVKNFSRFQHYKDRRPLWIKFYGSILDDYAFVQLPDAAKAHLMLLWQVAATHANRIPYDQRYLQQATKAKSRINLEGLIAAGFLIDADSPANMEDVASGPLAEPEHPASPEKNREEKSREETTSSSLGPSFDASKVELIGLLGTTALAHQEVDTFLAGIDTATRRFSWVRNLVTSLQGAGGPGIPPAAMLSALIDFNLADRQASPYNGAVFRAFVDRAMKPRLERPTAKASENDDAQAAVTAILALTETEGRSRFIRRAGVEALGPKVVAAYDALGGAEKFLATTPDKLSFLVRDFAAQLRITNAA